MPAVAGAARSRSPHTGCDGFLGMSVTEEDVSKCYTSREMSRLFESFEFLNRGWDDRALENSSVRTIFLCLLLGLFILGMITFMLIYMFFQQHRFNLIAVTNSLLWAVIMFRYARIVYRRLGP